MRYFYPLEIFNQLDQYRPEIKALLKKSSTQRCIPRRYQTTEVNLCKRLDKNELRTKSTTITKT